VIVSVEPKKPSPAVLVLCQQLVSEFTQKAEQLGQIAFETDGINKEDGWRLDVFNGAYVKPDIQPPDAK
jgi:hypothetical protein